MKLLAAFLVGTLLLAADLCQPTPEVSQDLKRVKAANAAGPRRLERVRKTAEEIAAKHPQDFFALSRYERAMHMSTPAERSLVIARLKNLMEDHPDNAGFAVLYARSLVGKDTPTAIKLLQSASAHPGSYLTLADIYNYGRFTDKAQASAALQAYFAACPASVDEQALSLLQRHATPEVAQQHVARLRALLTQETDAERLRSWDAVWNLEFITRPASEHAAIRKQIASDVARLERTDWATTEQGLSVLLSGSKQANSSEATQRLEERLLAEHPKSSLGRSVREGRWQKEHPWPNPSETNEKKQEYSRTLLAHTNAQLEESPDDLNLLSTRFFLVQNSSDATPEQVGAAGDKLLAASRQWTDVWAMPPFAWQAAKAFMQHKTRLDQVPGLVEEGRKSVRERDEWRSDRDVRDKKSDDNMAWQLKADAARILVDAARALKKPELAQAAIAELEAFKTEKPGDMILTWSALGKYAELQDRQLDALLLYRAALAALPADKKLKDELTEDTQRLFKQLGGTAATRELWDQQNVKVDVAEGGRWGKPNKTMADWQLQDLTGKTWKLTSLEGKTLLINVWSSWCGPCRSEHPYLEKLYQKVKDRKDIEILTFNVDDEVGKVQPYMQEQKLTFPVLLAREYVEELLPLLSIPRNWIVDAKGKWRLEQIGFGQDENWEKMMLDKIEQTKPE